MSSTSFRQVNVDRLDPESSVNQFPDITPSGLTLEDVRNVSAQAKSALQSGNVGGALATVLANPPYGSDEATKDAALDAVLSVLTAVRGGDISPAVQDLAPQERTVLVKYLYKAMGTSAGQANGTILLNWLEKTLEISGTAPITKHINDRRTV